MKGRKSNINEHNDSWAVVCCIGFSGKCEPVGMINNPYQRIAFAIGWARNGT